MLQMTDSVPTQPESLKFFEKAKPRPVHLRRKVEIPDLPLTWTTNLTDEQVHELYSALLNRQFFVGFPDHDIQADGATVKFSIQPRFDQIAYLDGMCMAIMLFGTVTLVYRTSEEWQVWEEWQAEQSRIKTEQDKRKRKLWAMHDHLYDLAHKQWDAGHTEEAEQLFLECKKLAEEYPNVLQGWRDAPIKLIYLYADLPDPSRGLDYLDQEFDRPQYYHIMAYQNEHEQPGIAERIYRHAINRFQNDAGLFKALALLLARVGRNQDAISVCEEAIMRGLKDDTKSGFEGRLDRLKKRLESPK